MSSFTLKYIELAELIFNHGIKDVATLFVVVQDKYNICDYVLENNCKKKLKTFYKNFKDKWQVCYRQQSRFYCKNTEWLKNQIEFAVEDSTIEQQPSTSGLSRSGRPKKDFMDCSERQKRSRSRELLLSNSFEEIQYTHEKNLRSSGHKEEAQIINALADASPKRKMRILDILEDDSSVIPMQPQEALALMVDAKLTKNQYNRIRWTAKSHNANIYPSYRQIQMAKAKCYPENSSIEISSSGAKVGLQSLLNHTIERLCETDEVKNNIESTDTELELISKYGMDGSSGQSQYKQIFRNENGEIQSDASVMMTSIVPLQLKSKEKIIWENPLPSSTRYCRPMRFFFQKETTDFTKLQHLEIKNEISNLVNSQVISGENYVSIKHNLELTMLDGKAINALTDTKSTLTCNICGAKTSEMNNFDLIKAKECNNYEYGLSTLHCWIRCLEFILSLAYKLPVKKWRKSKEDDNIISERKKTIQMEFRKTKGLFLDMPKQGYGSTNDGNTARRFFADPTYAAQITGIDETYIYRLSVILRTMSCGQVIDTTKFKTYAEETADLHLNLYQWYNLPPTIHKILFHGADIISAHPLALGKYSEEAQESRNKDFKRIRQFNTRKTGRIETNEDLLNGLLITSDPVISSIRYKAKHKVSELPEDATFLLKL